jgi:prefoldin subunit 5
MSPDSSELIELDRLSIEILKGLSELGGEATSVDLRKTLGVEKRQKLFYRFNEYLVPEGLVETRQPEKDEPGPHPPKIAVLTDYGQEYVEGLDHHVSTGEVADRLERLEEQVEGLRQENQALREENEELKAVVDEADVESVTSRVTELTDDVDRLQAKMSNIQEAVGETQTHPLIQSRETAEGFDAMLVMVNACRRVIESEVEDGEERFREELEAARTSLRESGRLLMDSKE